MNHSPLDPALLAPLEERAAAATRSGRMTEALDLWARVLELAPRHLAALTQIGQAAYRRGDMPAARSAFERACEAEPGNARRWVNLALVLEQQGDDAALEGALFKALSIEPRELMALLVRGRLHERRGEAAKAAAAYGGALAVAPPPAQLMPDLRPLVEHAQAYSQRRRAELAAHVDERIEGALRECGGGRDVERFRLSLDILLGRKRRHDSQALVYHYPHLLPVEFFERSEFPWLDPIEAATGSIRDEFLAAAADRDRADAFVPYIQYGADLPVDQWAGLNHNPDWSVLHLVQGGEVVPANAERCPQTMRLWADHVPAPRQAGRTPVALFSLLKPRTRIPPHTGASNVRLLAHLPLIVPPGCRFRVGNTVREWVEGRAWVFDDTIEHEAWNDSDRLRVVMIFDHWHPQLSAAERRLITALNEALNGFDGGSAAAYSA